MKHDSPENYNCEFAAETLDFLYGEMNREQKNVFEKHLTSCTDCADVIENFADLRFSIQNWKASEFDKLPTPKILIPYKNLSVNTLKNEKPVSWVESLRNYLSMSPIYSGALAVLIIALLTAFGIFFLNRNGDENLLAETNKKQDLNVKPTIENKTEEQTPQIIEIPEKRTENEAPEAKQKSVDSVPVQVNTGTKQKIQPVNTVEKKTTKSKAVNDTKNTKTVPNRNRPRLNELPEEDEDNSLRLTDLFAELETKD